MEPQELTAVRDDRDTIAAVATPHGEGGLAVIRVSGPQAFDITARMWRGKRLADCPSHTAHLGEILQDDGNVLDQAVLTLFRAPNSFTGEDTVELSVHGSRWIQREAMARLTSLGARAAGPGEFSRRAFANGRMDLAQTEAIADLISASSKAAHRLAIRQMNGSFSRKLNELRQQLIQFASLLELELDFSEEDVEFADRSRLISLAEEILTIVRRLAHSYSTGRVFKEGVPVAIAGAPNVGKSTLLNYLLNDDKAIVSDIPGTTRDVIEDTHEIKGTLFRFYDTAGLRDTDDAVERIGIQRAKDHIERAAIILWVLDASRPMAAQLAETQEHLDRLERLRGQNGYDTGMTPVNLFLLNKCDRLPSDETGAEAPAEERTFLVSARTGAGMAEVEEAMLRAARTDHDPDSELIVTNARHHAALSAGAEALDRALAGLRSGLSADFVAQDVREAIHHLGLVTGAVATDDLLSTIFSHFCIGK